MTQSDHSKPRTTAQESKIIEDNLFLAERAYYGFQRALDFAMKYYASPQAQQDGLTEQQASHMYTAFYGLLVKLNHETQSINHRQEITQSLMLNEDPDASVETLEHINNALNMELCAQHLRFLNEFNHGVIETLATMPPHLKAGIIDPLEERLYDLNTMLMDANIHLPYNEIPHTKTQGDDEPISALSALQYAIGVAHQKQQKAPIAPELRPLAFTFPAEKSVTAQDIRAATFQNMVLQSKKEVLSKKRNGEKNNAEQAEFDPQTIFEAWDGYRDQIQSIIHLRAEAITKALQTEQEPALREESIQMMDKLLNFREKISNADAAMHVAIEAVQSNQPSARRVGEGVLQCMESYGEICQSLSKSTDTGLMPHEAKAMHGLIAKFMDEANDYLLEICMLISGNFKDTVAQSRANASSRRQR